MVHRQEVDIIVPRDAPVLLSAIFLALLVSLGTVWVRHGKTETTDPSKPRTPPYPPITYPLLGSLQYFRGPWDFFRTAAANGSVSFHLAGQRCIALSTDTRQPFFSDSKTDLTLGYAVMLAGAPNLSRDFMNTAGVDITLNGRSYKLLATLIRQERVVRSMPTLYAYAYDGMDGRAGTTINPFETFPQVIFRLTAATMTSSLIAANPAACTALLKIFHGLEVAATPITVLFPWFFGPDRMRRCYLMWHFYHAIRQAIDERKAAGRDEDDAMQFLMDEGLSTIEITQFAIAVLYTGNANTAVIAPALLCDLVTHPTHLSLVKDEIHAFISSFNENNTSLPLRTRIESIAYEDWVRPGALPVLERCLKETIRLRMATPLHRLNNTDADIQLGDAVVPRGAVAIFHTSFVHHDEHIFPAPLVWDPDRFTAARAEDKKTPVAFVGWGAGRHPCLGQKARLFLHPPLSCAPDDDFSSSRRSRCFC
ncbi:cytochrome P450 [Mycena filopes]|nr:cytochrome P450 [Mycena filopes]